MRLAQIVFPDGRVHAALVEGSEVVDVAFDGTQRVDQFVALAASRKRPLQDLVSAARSTADRSYPLADLLSPASPDAPRLGLPIHPPEVWGCGVTYKKSAEFRDDDTRDTTKGIYDRVYTADRPEIFFKATAHRCVGHNEPIGVRKDSTFTAPEPELAFILGPDKQVLGFTIANDVSAWDIERDNPLYLPLSKIYDGCCALGPWIVTADEIGDPYSLDMRCTIRRDGRVIFEGEVNTSRINRSLDHLIHHLTLSSSTPVGTVVCTGTGIIVGPEHALRQGDTVEIRVDGIGVLSNPVRQLEH